MEDALQIRVSGNFRHLGLNVDNVAELDFDSMRAEGAIFPLLVVNLKARTFVQPNPQHQYSIQPTKVVCHLHLLTP